MVNPVEITTGLVIGVFYSARVDTSNDPDIEPDITYSVGSGLLVPSESELIITRGDGSRYSLHIKSVPFIINNGSPKTPSGDALRVIASVGQYSGADPNSWFWKVKNLVLDGMPMPDTQINVDPAQPADLALMLPITGE